MMAEQNPNNRRTPEAGRPHLPKDYGVDAYNLSGVISWDWVSQQMAAARNYWISSARPDGRPHAAPVWGVWLDETLYFGTGRLSRKGRNLSANPQVVAHLESGDQTVILEGQVEEIEDLALIRRVARAYAAKYPPYEPSLEPDSQTVTYALRPRVVFAWREQDFPTSATRWRF